MATMRSPRAGRVAKGTSPRVGGKPASKVFLILHNHVLCQNSCEVGWYRKGVFCWQNKRNINWPFFLARSRKVLWLFWVKSDFFAQPDETLRGKRRSSYGIKKDKKVVANLSNNGSMAVMPLGKKWKEGKANLVHVGICISGSVFAHVKFACLRKFFWCRCFGLSFSILVGNLTNVN